jgi:hypothetical protein
MLREMLQIDGFLKVYDCALTPEKSAEIKEKNSRRPTWFYEYQNILLLPGCGSDVASTPAYGELFDSYEAQGELDANQPKIDR